MNSSTNDFDETWGQSTNLFDSLRTSTAALERRFREPEHVDLSELVCIY
jgi:hypothetical protein